MIFKTKRLLILSVVCFVPAFSYAAFATGIFENKKKPAVGEVENTNTDNLQVTVEGRGGPSSTPGPVITLLENDRYLVQLPEGPGSKYVDESGRVFEHGQTYDVMPGNAKPKD